MKNIDAMYAGYVDALLWAEAPLSMDETDSDDSFEDLGYTPGRIAPVTVESIRKDCALFYHLAQNCGIKFPPDLEQVGIDLYLTRQHHGAGFWDSPELYGKEPAERLTQLVHENFKTVYAWIDDTGYIQIMEG